VPERARGEGSRGELRAAAAALTFLTILPVGRRAELGSEDVSRGSWLFPVIGAAVGAASAGVAMLLQHHLPVLVVAALTVGVEAILTGAMHVDALADTSDALGGRTRQRVLEIMRDHSIGAFGVAAVALDLLVRAACVAALVETHHLVFLIVAAALSRATAAPLGASLPYARSEPGNGSLLSKGASVVGAVASAIIGIAIAAALVGTDAITPCAAAVLLTIATSVGCRAWLGGVTGDILGANIELCSTLVLLAAVWTT